MFWTVAVFAVKTAWPDAFVATLAGEIVEVPAPWPRLTVLPETTLLFASFSVTVIVEVATLSATIGVVAVTVDWAAVTAPGTNVTVAVCVTTTLLVVSVAVYVTA